MELLSTPLLTLFSPRAILHGLLWFPKTYSFFTQLVFPSQGNLLYLNQKRVILRSLLGVATALTAYHTQAVCTVQLQN